MYNECFRPRSQGASHVYIIELEPVDCEMADQISMGAARLPVT